MQLKCPICGAPTDSKTSADFPFCSERCRVQDLGNWASGKYVISSPAFDEDFDEAAAEADPEATPPANGKSQYPHPHDSGKDGEDD